MDKKLKDPQTTLERYPPFAAIDDYSKNALATVITTTGGSYWLI